MKINKVQRVSFYSGLIAWLLTNNRRTLDNAIRDANAEGWNCIQIIKQETANIFMRILAVLVLILTIGLWTFGAGYLLLLEKEVYGQN